MAYIKARLQLAGIEGKEAAVHYAIILGMAIGALVLTLFGYFFLIFGLIFLVALLCGGGNAWIWVTLGAALLHLGGAVALLFVGKGKLAQPMLTNTMQEFKKDQEWLRTPANLN
ncbi:MAG TPA: phage holin family protein [Chthoniobacteraceae bacterium]